MAEAAKLKWKDDRASTPLGDYVLVKHRIRHGRTYETEWEASLGEKVIGIADTKPDAKMIAQAHYRHKLREVEHG